MRLVLDIGKKYTEITGPVSDVFAEDLAQAATNEFDILVLDFNGTRTISSMAMGVIFSTYQKLRERGKALQIVNASDKVKHLMRMVNMADLIVGENIPKTKK